MTQPNMKFPFMSHHCMNRFAEGRHFTPPRREVIQATLFIMARCVEHLDLEVTAWSFMGNHPHALVQDRDPTAPFSRVSEFQRMFHSILARWAQDHWEYFDGPVFEPRLRAQQVALADEEAECWSIAYIENNPVAAGLCDHPAEVEGGTSLREFLFEPLTVERPDAWFDPRKWPEKFEILVAVPHAARRAGHTRLSWYLKTKAAVESLRATILMNRGPELATPASQRLKAAKSKTPYEPGKSITGRRVAHFCGNDKALLARLFAQLRAFRRAYRRARERMREGATDVIFPYGTVRLAACFGIDVFAPP